MPLMQRADDRLIETEAEDLSAMVDHGLRILSALSGLAHENMNRLDGWRFLDLGMRVERAIAVARFVRRLIEPSSVRSVALESGSLNCLLDLVDGQLAYRARYLVGPARRPVLDLALFDQSHPRSVAYQVAEICLHLDQLARQAPGELIASAASEAKTLSDLLAATDPSVVGADWILACESALMTVSDAITQTYLAGLPVTTD